MTSHDRFILIRVLAIYIPRVRFKYLCNYGVEMVCYFRGTEILGLSVGGS